MTFRYSKDMQQVPVIGIFLGLICSLLAARTVTYLLPFTRSIFLTLLNLIHCGLLKGVL